ncbi:hypothetical protein B0H12DRAFT_1091185 [Mycena haematopus]|nr:hypothetical protein B0H12DRAFT_1091185 [Mycena haematopus]
MIYRGWKIRRIRASRFDFEIRRNYEGWGYARAVCVLGKVAGNLGQSFLVFISIQRPLRSCSSRIYKSMLIGVPGPTSEWLCKLFFRSSPRKHLDVKDNFENALFTLRRATKVYFDLVIHINAGTCLRWNCAWLPISITMVAILQELLLHLATFGTVVIVKSIYCKAEGSDCTELVPVARRSATKIQDVSAFLLETFSGSSLWQKLSRETIGLVPSQGGRWHGRFARHRFFYLYVSRSTFEKQLPIPIKPDSELLEAAWNRIKDTNCVLNYSESSALGVAPEIGVTLLCGTLRT